MCEVPIVIVHFLEDYLVCTDFKHTPDGKVRMKLCLHINTRNVEKVINTKVFNLYLSLMNYRFGVKLDGAFQDLGFLWKDLIRGWVSDMG